MSWQLVSFLILALVLVAGFAWYELSRPPSQVVALVAALAAMAIGGRVLFAAFPNVKPTTDLVIFAGYALGGAPGFAVGALAALVSNFWFGQGPWTPWQMVGWGLCGVLGAALALGTRKAGRLALAASCGLAGIAFGTLLNFSLMATYGGEMSWRYFGILEARAVPFEIAALIGNVAFALLAGPAIVRMLRRFRERFEWERGQGEAPRRAAPRRRAGAGALAALLTLVLALGALAPAPARASEVGDATAWLVAQQNADGGFATSPGAKSGAAMTAWAMLGLEAAGRNPLDVASGGHTPVDFLRSQVDQQRSAGDLARTILALQGAGVDPRRFGGQNLVAALLTKRRRDGSFEGWPGTTAFATIALRAAGADGGLTQTLTWLRQAQGSDGGWGDLPGAPSTADDTGAVLQAIAPGSKAVGRALSYLRRTQRPGGGWPLGGGGVVNTQSTAWAVQGILAARGNPSSYRRGGSSALDYLAARQAADGHFRYSKSRNQTPVWVTSQVLVAAAGDYLPLAVPPRAPQPKPKSQPKPASKAPAPSPSSTMPSPPASIPTPLPAVPPAGAAGSGGGTNRSLPKGGSSGAPSFGAGTASPAAPPSSSAEVPGTPLSPPGAEAVVPTTEQPAAIPVADSPPTSQGSDSSAIAGAILIGALAGCLAFLAALGARRWWRRWRYGW